MISTQTNSIFRIFLFFSLILVSLAFAECSVTTLTTSAATAAQVGDSVVVTVTYSGSGCSGSQLYLDASAGLSASPAYRTLSSDSGSVTFSITASVADTYTYNARLSTSESTEASIEFVSPDVLVVTDDSEPETVTDQALNDAFEVSIVISNPSAANITTTYSFTYDDDLMSITGSSSGSLTVNSGDITTLTRSFTPIDYFTDEEINFNLGSNYGAFVTTVSTIEDPGEEEDDEGDGSAGITRTGTNITTSNDTGTEEENDTITPPPAPPTTPPVTPPTNVTGAEVQAILDTVSTELSQATIDGKDITAAQNKYYEAQAAFSRGDYALAKQLANEALSLVRAATKPTTKPPSGTPQANATTNASGTPSTGQGKSDNMLLLGGIVLIVVLVGLVVAYFMLKKGGSSGNDKSYARKK